MTARWRRVRALALTLHLWLGMASAIAFAIAAGTGAVLAYRAELERWLVPATSHVTPGDVGWEVAAERLRAAHPQATLQTLWFPRWNKPYYEGYLVSADGSSRNAALDPGRGVPIPLPGSEAAEWLDAIGTLHTSLVGTTAGYNIMIAATIVSLVVLLSGLVVWWPGRARWRSGLRVRGDRPLRIVNYDVHRVTGVLSAPLLALMCATAVIMAWPAQTAALLARLAGDRTPALSAWTEVRSGAQPVDWSPDDVPRHADLLADALARTPAAQPFYITWPQTPDEPIHVRLQTGIDPQPFGITTRLAYDRWTGTLLQVIDPRTMRTSDRIAQHWATRLHYGDFSPLTKAVWALACVIGVGLVITGVAVWWWKRRPFFRPGRKPASVSHGGHAEHELQVEVARDFESAPS